MPVIEQNVNILDLSFKSGDDFAFDIQCPFSLSGATTEATIGAISFTITPITDTSITLSLTEAETATLVGGESWKLRITKGGYTRTYFEGKYIQI